MSTWRRSWAGCWAGTWGRTAPRRQTQWEEPPIQPGAFAPLSRSSSPITQPFPRRTRKRRELDLLIL
jgi:hypothetical protein